MRGWKKAAPLSEIEIDADGLTRALEQARVAELRKEYDRKVIVFAHIVESVVKYAGDFPKNRLPKRRLFEVLNVARFEAEFKQGVKNYRSDEEATDFMRDLYEEFKAWRKKNPKRRKE